MISLLLYAVADRFCGSDVLKGKKGRPVWLATPALMLASLPMGMQYVWLALAWGLYRGLTGWKVMGHSAMTPLPKDLPFAFLRHSYLMFFLILMLQWQFIPLAFAFAVGTTMLAMYQGRENARGVNVNDKVEWARGVLMFVVTISDYLLAQ